MEIMIYLDDGLFPNEMNQHGNPIDFMFSMFFLLDYAWMQLNTVTAKEISVKLHSYNVHPFQLLNLTFTGKKARMF